MWGVLVVVGIDFRVDKAVWIGASCGVGVYLKSKGCGCVVGGELIADVKGVELVGKGPVDVQAECESMRPCGECVVREVWDVVLKYLKGFIEGAGIGQLMEGDLFGFGVSDGAMGGGDGEVQKGVYGGSGGDFEHGVFVGV